MAKMDSFKKAAENATKAAGFKNATKKLDVVNFADEFKSRGIVLGNNGLEK